jgi:toxin FitB
VILLDTNVLSAVMRDEADPVVVSWLDSQPPQSIWTTAITVFEIRFGLEILGDGRRRRQLEEAFVKALEKDLDGRVLPFDQPAALAAGVIAADQRRQGRPIEIRDVQIAGIAATREAALATRNTRHFEGTGIPLLNPWKV